VLLWGESEKANNMLKTEVFLSFLLILMSSIDCLTTVIGFVYLRASELNPFMASILSANIGAFLFVKIGTTIFVVFTYILANRLLMKARSKTGKSFKYSLKLIKAVYMGIVFFLVIVVANNLLVLSA
jgi:hypothetical protein